ncbi:Nitrogen assimilation transcription factor nirA [Colletotrichum sp. SAR 10_65]|nr:Nitrogen assimilation transcription factor nirA [Colletotrichum sp. SAR 10_65]
MCSVAKRPCVYPVPEGLSLKEAQKQKFTNVSRAHESSRKVLELLSASQDGASNEILQQLKHSKHLDKTIQSIADASLLLPTGDGADEMETSPTIASQPEDNILADTAQNLAGSIESSLRSLSAESADTGTTLPVSRWTTVLKDDRILTQLLELFWTWDGTLSRLVARDIFSAELSNADAQQKHQFCSPLLVNAILAVSSLHSMRKHSSLHTDAKNISQKFADHAFDLLDAEQGVFTAECSLCEIIDQFVSGFISNDTQHPILDSGRCTALYNKLLCWKLSLPDHLMTSNSVLPSILLLQTTYDFVALKLLAMFTIQSGPDFDGRSAVSLQTLHASSMISSLWIYRGLYTLKHEYWAAEHCSFAVHVLLPQMAEPAVHDTIAKACCVLHEMGIRSGVSGRAAELLRDIEETARARGIRIPPYGKGSKSPEADAMPTFVVNGARLFDGSRGGFFGDADENGCAVSFDSIIGDIQQAQPR